MNAYRRWMSIVPLLLSFCILQCSSAQDAELNRQAFSDESRERAGSDGLSPSTLDELQDLISRVHRQEETIAAIRDLGGTIAYEHEITHDGVQLFVPLRDSRQPNQQTPPDVSLPDPVPPGPRWLRELVGERYLVRLVKVAFDRASDEDVAALKDLELGTVEHLLLACPTITDIGVGHIEMEAFPNLRRLRLDESRVTDEGLEHLARNFSSLEKLYLSYTDVSDAGISRLSTLENLRFLDVTATDVTSDGIEELKEHLPHLTVSGP